LFGPLVPAGSNLAPECQIIPQAKGVKKLEPGQITLVVLAREATQEPNRLVLASVGLARPKNRKQYGYISEHHGFGQTHKKASDFAEDLAATMLASTLGIELDPDKDWNERKMVYQVGERQFVSRSTAQNRVHGCASLVGGTDRNHSPSARCPVAVAGGTAS
jgi:arginine decarboxylase